MGGVSRQAMEAGTYCYPLSIDCGGHTVAAAAFVVAVVIVVIVGRGRGGGVGGLREKNTRINTTLVSTHTETNYLCMPVRCKYDSIVPYLSGTLTTKQNPRQAATADSVCRGRGNPRGAPR